jgi:SAM-dependent methyltransferase
MGKLLCGRSGPLPGGEKQLTERGDLTEAEIITKSSYDSISSKWADTHNTPKFWQENFDEFYKALPGGRVLEIGCGSGRDAKELIEHGYEYVGTDISGSQIEEARKNNPDAKFEQISLYDINFAAKFDGFWAAAVLIHVPKDRINEALQAIQRNMHPGAIGFIAMKEGQGERVEVKDYLDNTQYLFTYWQRDEFRDVLQSHGMSSIYEGYIPMSEKSKWLTYIVKVDDSYTIDKN